MNLPIILAAALIPLVMGFIWYNPNVLGKAWMAAAGLDEEKVKGANMPLIFGLSYVFAIMIGVVLNGITIHQAGVDSLFAHLQGAEDQAYLANFKATYGHVHRSFGHGAVHGAFAGVFFAMPILTTNALFERKGFKYIAINAGYWIVSAVLMGGVICQFA